MPGYRRRQERAIACRVRRSGSMPHVRELRLPFGGAMISIPPAPTTTVITTIGTGRRVSIDSRRFQWTPSSPTPLVSIRCMAMSGNGCRIPGTRIMTVRLWTVRLGWKKAAARVCCGAARGPTDRSGCAGLRATGTSRTSGSRAGVFAWPGLSLNPLIFFTFPSFLGAIASVFSAFFGVKLSTASVDKARPLDRYSVAVTALKPVRKK